MSRARQKEPFAKRLGKAALLVVLLPIILPLAVVSLALYLPYLVVLYSLVWALWLPRGKDILFVYSDSPIWHEYMETQILPLVRQRAIVLNWSARSKWSQWSLRVSVFRHFGGSREFNPLVVKFQLFRRAKILRYWSAFQDWKRGYTEPVERLYKELSSML